MQQCFVNESSSWAGRNRHCISCPMDRTELTSCLQVALGRCRAAAYLNPPSAARPARAPMASARMMTPVSASAAQARHVLSNALRAG